MARMLRARARGVIMPRRASQLPLPRPVFPADWYSNSGPAREPPVSGRRARLVSVWPFKISRRGAARVGIAAPGTERDRSRLRQRSCLAEERPWKR